MLANYTSILSSIFLDEFVLLEKNIKIFKDQFLNCDSYFVENLKIINNIYYRYDDIAGKFYVERGNFNLSFNDFIKHLDDFKIMELERKIFMSIRYEVDNATLCAHQYIKSLIHVRNKLAHADRNYEEPQLLVSDKLIKILNSEGDVEISKVIDFSNEDIQTHRYLKSYIFHLKKINSLILKFINCIEIIQINYRWFTSEKNKIIKSDSSTVGRDIARLELPDDKKKAFINILNELNIEDSEIIKFVKAYNRTSEYVFN